jgi:predicted transcriptional regulator
MEIVPALQVLGFGDYEARAYLALVKRSPLNGYELAKASGVPRANIYAVLERLSARRAVVRVDEPAGSRYAPVPPAELLRRLGGEFQAVAEETSRALEALSAAAEHEAVWNLRGYAAVLDQARTAIRAAQRSLLVAIRPEEARALRDDLAAAHARGVDVTTLCMAACAQECGNCEGRVYRYHVASSDGARRLVVVPDGAEVLAGEVLPDDEASAVKTRQRLLVDVSSAYIRHSIALATVVEDLGDRLDTMISPHTRAVLDTLGDGAGLLDELRRLLAAGPTPN